MGKFIRLDVLLLLGDESLGGLLTGDIIRRIEIYRVLDNPTPGKELQLLYRYQRRKGSIISVKEEYVESQRLLRPFADVEEYLNVVVEDGFYPDCRYVTAFEYAAEYYLEDDFSKRSTSLDKLAKAAQRDIASALERIANKHKQLDEIEQAIRAMNLG